MWKSAFMLTVTVFLPIACADAAPAADAPRESAERDHWRTAIEARLAATPAGDREERPLVGVAPGARITRYDGSETAPVATTGAWHQLYHEIVGAPGFDRGWPDIVTLRERWRREYRDGAIPVAMLDIAYRHFARRYWDDEGADAERLDAARISDSVLATSRLFCAAPLRSRTHRGGRVAFVFDREFLFTDRRDHGPRLEVDFADGRGYRPVAFGTPTGVSYASTGPKVVELRAVWPDGATARARFRFDVEHLQTPDPDETWVVAASIPYAGGFGSGLAYVYLAEGHTALTNPVVVIEGFDIDNSTDWDELYQRMNEENLLESLRSEGFDFVGLNFDDSNDFIQRHAFLTVALLERINDEVPTRGETVVVGASMGGLVGRYALAYMEQHGLEHEVRTFIAFDSPQQGANIPLGLQHWVDFFAGQSAEAALLRDVLNEPSPRQMLVYHYAATPPPDATGDALRFELDQELADLGEYPQSLRNVAVANGSGTQLDQGYPAGDQIVLYEYYSFFVDIVGNVWAVPDGTGQVIFDGLIDQIWPLPDDAREVFVSGTRPYDTAPGGFRPSMVQLDTTSVPFGDLVALQDNHCFIPTVSSLDIATADLFEDIAGDPDILSRTPFDAIYYPVENQEHNIVTPENVIWFRNEVRGIVTAVAGSTTPGALRPVDFRVYPNPFNPRAHVAFDLDREQRLGVAVYDAAGRRIAVLAERAFAPGQHRIVWNGLDAGGRAVATGTYVVRIDNEAHAQTRKLTLIR